MASIYRREDSPRVWIRYKGADGKWKGKGTEYRWDNPGDVQQARKLARMAAQREADEAAAAGRSTWPDWPLSWIAGKYGSQGNTSRVYRRHWTVLTGWMRTANIKCAGDIQRDHLERYIAWREINGGGRNTAIMELKTLTMVLEEARQRGYVERNPLRRPGLRKAKAKEKLIWSDQAMRKASAHFEDHGPRWMRAALYFGIYQAARLRQCQLPLRCIRLDLGVLQYPDELVKGGSGYTQPIDPRFLPILEGLVAEARAEGDDVLCVIPWDASLRLRKALDRAGCEGLVHHGLRATWITRAAERGIQESMAMAFCHHASREVHRIYKRLSAISLAGLPELMDLPALSVDQQTRSPATS